MTSSSLYSSFRQKMGSPREREGKGEDHYALFFHPKRRARKKEERVLRRGRRKRGGGASIRVHLPFSSSALLGKRGRGPGRRGKKKGEERGREVGERMTNAVLLDLTTFDLHQSRLILRGKKGGNREEKGRKKKKKGKEALRSSLINSLRFGGKEKRRWREIIGSDRRGRQREKE